MVDGFLILGLRHWDQKMHNQVKIIQRTYPTLDTKKTIQGFVDGYGTFLTREEAWKRATLTGQLDNYKGHNPGVLFSEDLY
jgi:hypothetical protein